MGTDQGPNVGGGVRGGDDLSVPAQSQLPTPVP